MPGISRVAFQIGDFPVYWYGITMALAIAAGVMTASLREERYGFAKDTVINLALWIVPAALIGARAYYVIFSWDQFAGNPWAIFDLRGGGLALYGSVIGGLAVGSIYAKAKRLSFAGLTDLAAPGIALGQAIGRWGNFFNQEAYGVASAEGFKWFPASVMIEADGTWHLATFFYESVWCLGVFIFLLAREKRHPGAKRGSLFFWYVLLYAVERMLVEGLRTDSLYWGPVRVSQALSALLAICAIICLLLNGRNQGKTNRRGSAS